MHKRNTFLIALLLAFALAGFTLVAPGLSDGAVFNAFFLLPVMVSLLLAGGLHAPGPVSWWCSFLAFSLFYWGVLLVAYALALEVYLVRQAFRSLDAHVRSLGPEHELRPEDTFEALGRALHDLETHRRRHWLLADAEELDLTLAPQALAARALTRHRDSRPVKKLMKRYQATLGDRVGTTVAARMVKDLHEQAQRSDNLEA